MTLLGHTIVVGLAAFFVFYALNNAPFLRPVHSILARLHPMLPRCPWCLSPYVALPLAVAVTLPDSTLPTFLVHTALVTLAAAAVAGVLGTLVPFDDGEPT